MVVASTLYVAHPTGPWHFRNTAEMASSVFLAKNRNGIRALDGG